MLYRTIQTTILLILASIFSLSAGLLSSSQPPTGHTGATSGITCADCHSGSALNATGGSVVINGLPATYTPGSVYPFSVTITHGVSDRTRWGFAVRAVGSGNNDVGTFSVVAPSNAVPNERELGHINAPVTTAGTTYTFSNLRWTAPANPSAQEQAITFYVAGNAANGDFSTTGDNIYTVARSMTLLSSSVHEVVPGVKQWRVLNSPGSSVIVVKLSLTAATAISFSLYDAGGRRILSVPMQKFVAGEHQQLLRTGTFSRGIYILEISSGVGKASQTVFLHD
jgi:hypothetical protein